MVAEVAGANTRTAAWMAVIASTVLLTVYSFLAGHRGGLGLGGSLVSASIGAVLGILIILMKSGLH
jgi:hypothetical protein